MECEETVASVGNRFAGMDIRIGDVVVGSLADRSLLGSHLPTRAHQSPDTACAQLIERQGALRVHIYERRVRQITVGCLGACLKTETPSMILPVSVPLVNEFYTVTPVFNVSDFVSRYIFHFFDLTLCVCYGRMSFCFAAVPWQQLYEVRKSKSV